MRLLRSKIVDKILIWYEIRTPLDNNGYMSSGIWCPNNFQFEFDWYDSVERTYLNGASIYYINSRLTYPNMVNVTTRQLLQNFHNELQFFGFLRDTRKEYLHCKSYTTFTSYLEDIFRVNGRISYETSAI